MIKAVIFDFDGLILDTETPLYEAYSEVYRQHGVELTPKRWSSFLGTTADPCDDLQERLQMPINRSAVQRSAMERHDQLMQKQGLRPGVEECLNSARRLGLKIGLASSALRMWVEAYLHKFHLYDYFNCIRTGTQAERKKPDPELYQQVLDCLQVDPVEAIAFEDSLHGLRAAKGARIRCVAVPNPITSHLCFDGCDLELSSMTDMTLDQIISTLETAEEERK